MKKITGIALLLIAVAGALLGWAWLEEFWMQILCWGIATALFLWGLYLIFGPFRRKKYATVQRLVLINGDGERDKEWVVAEGTSLLIGRNTPGHYVDIDLSGNRYEAFVAKSHAVLNRVGVDWYVEDLDTVNGVGIKKSGTDYNYRIQPHKPYKIDIGDIIYIAKLRLLAK